MRDIRIMLVLSVVLGFFISPSVLIAKPSSCEDCHVKLTPKQVADFNRGKMSETMTCADCHGTAHQNEKDVNKAELPTIATCKNCHEDQVNQYMSGKHAMGLVALEAMPYTHAQPKAFIEGRKGCGGCHTLGVTDKDARATEARKYYKYGMDCQNCHTRHAYSKTEAAQPEACMTCHQGFDHAQWEMYSGSKHGVAYTIARATNPKMRERDKDKDKEKDKVKTGHEQVGKATDRAPTCQTCHMTGGNHRVMSAWGFLALRLPEQDQEWMGYRATILKALGVLDQSGNPTPRLEAVKAAKMARLTEDEFKTERQKYVAVCQQCHSPSFVQANFANSDQMIKEADKLMAEAITIVADLYKDGIIPAKDGSPAYPDLLAFYSVQTQIEQILYEMFMDHRMKTFQAGFHSNPDYATWYGYAKMHKDLVEIKELSATMRRDHKK